jgi:hypothetical protein
MRFSGVLDSRAGQLRRVVGVAFALVGAAGLAAGLAAVPTAAAASGPATHFVVSTPKALAVGNEVTIKVTAETATNKVASTYAGTVQIASSDPQFIPVSPSTLTKGRGAFQSALFTPGPQTISATDTVNSSISGSSGPIEVIRPSAVVVNVTGSPLASVTSSPEALTPPFNPAPSAENYVLACPTETGNNVTVTLSAASGGSITATGMSGQTVTLSKTLMADQALVLEAPISNGKKQFFWIRCLPPGFPNLQVTINSKPLAGWLLTGSDHYVMILTNTGTPVWWRGTGQYTPANLQVLQNDDLGWGWGFGGGNIIYNLDTGTTQRLSSNAHELQQLPDGDYLTMKAVITTGVTLTPIGLGSNQRIDNCVVEEFNPQLQLVWSWSSYTHISPNESELWTDTAGAWDVYHCNSIAADPNSPDPTNPNFIVSMRNTSAVYYVVNPEASTGAGQVVWKLGGDVPPAGAPDAGAQHYVVAGDADGGFFAQHDARIQPTGDVSLFDDGSPAQGSASCSHAARGVQFALHPATSTATVAWQYVAPSGRCATYMGSFRRYNNDSDNLIGWGIGTGDFISEVNKQGEPVLTISSPQSTGNYRAISVPFAALSNSQLRQDMGGVAPTVSGLAPSSGPKAGGTVVTVDGSGFTQATRVTFGTTPVSFAVNSDTSLTVTAPSAVKPGKVVVRVTNTAGTSPAKGAKRTFTYTK